MGKNKLRKFSEIDRLDFVYQYPFAVLQQEGFPHRGKWHEEVFGNDHPITLELGCGKGEYAVGLARRNTGRNYIGVDIKGARMWSGATQAAREGLSNIAFIRTSIELIDHFFAPGEVDEIWITFPDPQMKKVRKRLTSTRFIEDYLKILAPGGIIRLKTDSPFLFDYTCEMARQNGFEILASTSDLYADPNPDLPASLREIQTHYEKQWLDRGLTIKYIAFRPEDRRGNWIEPDPELFERDTYRSYSRGYIQMPQMMDPQSPVSYSND